MSQKEGVIYLFEPLDDVNFKLSSPGYSNGQGRFMEKMPGKIEFSLEGVGHGQFALSNSTQKMTGWIIKNGSSQQYFDTWVKTQ